VQLLFPTIYYFPVPFAAEYLAKVLSFYPVSLKVIFFLKVVFMENKFAESKVIFFIFGSIVSRQIATTVD
jgi:hypothetical protein